MNLLSRPTLNRCTVWVRRARGMIFPKDQYPKVFLKLIYIYSNEYKIYHHTIRKTPLFITIQYVRLQFVSTRLVFVLVQYVRSSVWTGPRNVDLLPGFCLLEARQHSWCIVDALLSSFHPIFENGAYISNLWKRFVQYGLQGFILHGLYKSFLLRTKITPPGCRRSSTAEKRFNKVWYNNGGSRIFNHLS